MSDEKRQQLRTRLIEAGIWGASEAGDPASNEADAHTLLNIMRDGLAPGYAFYFGGPGGSGLTPTRSITISGKAGNFFLASGSTRTEAICLGALALPSKLRLHPELAADFDLDSKEMNNVSST